MVDRLLKIAIATLFLIGHKTHRLLCTLCGKRLPPSLVILTYHPVKMHLLERFKKQMEMLLKMGRPVSLDGDIRCV
jgi:hypothetical protein